jgi:hypothetical protein
MVVATVMTLEKLTLLMIVDSSGCISSDHDTVEDWICLFNCLSFFQQQHGWHVNQLLTTPFTM